jgi:uncharacterized membrane protein (DUF485 family)
MSYQARDPRRTGQVPAAAAEGSVKFGLPLTVVLMAAYFGFIGLGAFAPSWLAVPVFAGGTTTWAFAYGLFVIGLGVALTGVYVVLANHRQG